MVDIRDAPNVPNLSEIGSHTLFMLSIVPACPVSGILSSFNGLRLEPINRRFLGSPVVAVSDDHFGHFAHKGLIVVFASFFVFIGNYLAYGTLSGMLALISVCQYNPDIAFWLLIFIVILSILRYGWTTTCRTELVVKFPSVMCL